MIERHTAEGDVTMGYDAEGHLVTVSGPNGYGASFSYDGDGNRVMSEENGKKTVFVGSIYETEQIGSEEAVVTKYYFAGSQRIVMRKDGVLTYLLTDQLGSTSLAADASGAKISEMRYKPWGEVRYESPSGSLPTDYTYTGQRSYTDSFGLMYYGARWYDPYNTHFISPDTVIADIIIPLITIDMRMQDRIL